MILVTVTAPKRKLRMLIIALAVLVLVALMLPMLMHRSAGAAAEQVAEERIAITVNGEIWPLESYYMPDIELMRVQ